MSDLFEFIGTSPETTPLEQSKRETAAELGTAQHSGRSAADDADAAVDEASIKSNPPRESDPAVKGMRPTKKWGPVPSFPGALFEGAGRYVRTETFFLDLSNAEDLDTYNQWLNKSRGPMASCVVKEEKRDFDWKVLLVVDCYEFQIYLPLERKNG